MTGDELERYILESSDTPCEFQPGAFYDPDGDCIEFLAKNENYRAERIDQTATVYYGQESGEIIGSLIKGVQPLLQRMLNRVPRFKIEIRDSRIKLEHIFTAQLWHGDDDVPADEVTMKYMKLRDVAEEVDAEINLQGFELV